MAVWKKEKKHRRKPWRTFRKKRRTNEIIRKICAAFLILELAFFVKNSGIVLVEIQSRKEYETEYSEDPFWKNSNEDSTAMEIFGFRLRIKEGAIEIYRKEEIKNIH